ncbi:MAG: hypothetical protein ACKV19_10085 [Verrucomicrobiales bacterium]
MPRAHRFCDHTELPPDRVFAESLNTLRQEHEIGCSSAILGHRVGTEKGDDAFPKADGRHGFFAFPAVGDFAEDAHVGGGLALGLPGQEPAVSPVSAQGSGILAKTSEL